MKTPFNENELPFKAFAKLGLGDQGALKLEPDDLNALLMGRRTSLVSLNDLKSDDFMIGQLDAKLSLSRSYSGEVELNIHPIYKEARKLDALTQFEADQLKFGVFSHLEKDMKASNGTLKPHIIEYDNETKEYIFYDPDSVLAPERVNGHKLSSSQKESYRNGDMLELPDGTRIQHRASEKQGILSDNTKLVLSVLLDGGLSYLLLRGVKNLIGNTEKQKELSSSYQSAYNDVLVQQSNSANSALNEFKPQYSRGYGHSSSR